MSSLLVGPGYNRPASVEWPLLLEHAQKAIDAGILPYDHSDNVMQEFYGNVAELDDAALEQNDAFGLGLIMCEVAKALRQPDVRLKVIESNSKSIVSSWRMAVDGRDYKRGLQVSDLVVLPYSYSLPIMRIAETAYNNLEPDARLVVNALRVETNFRRLIQAWESGAIDHNDYPMAPQHQFDFIVDGYPAAHKVGNNAFAASNNLLRNALYLIDGQYRTRQPSSTRPAKNPTSTDGQVIVTDFLENDALRKLNLDEVALRCASGIRLDKFNEYIARCIGLDGNGFVVFLKDKVTPARRLGPPCANGSRLGEQLLRCSAVHVDGLIPTVIDITKETAIRAEAMAQIVYARDLSKFRLLNRVLGTKF